MQHQMLTPLEVADLLQVSRDTVYRLAALGELPGRKVARVWRFPREDVDRYMHKSFDSIRENPCDD